MSCGRDIGCNQCQKGCKPARYARSFDSGCNQLGETDTKLSIDVGGATLNYAAERHTDIITGSMLGSIITLPDLRDVDFDYDFDAMCAEMVYHRYGECGNGCRSSKDAWTLFSIDQAGVKQNTIRYVRGANAYGCPVFLDVPSATNEWWLAGWRLDGQGNRQFGYFQPTPQTQINGNVMWVGSNGQINSSPMSNANFSINYTYCRGNDVNVGVYYYPSHSTYNIHIGPNSVHGMVTGNVSGQPSDSTVDNVNQDMIAIIHWCDDLSGANTPAGSYTLFRVTAYNSSETWSTDVQNKRASHFGGTIDELAVPASSCVAVPKGTHIILNVDGEIANYGGVFRVHQIRVTWIPSNLALTVGGVQ